MIAYSVTLPGNDLSCRKFSTQPQRKDNQTRSIRDSSQFKKACKLAGEAQPQDLLSLPPACRSRPCLHLLRKLILDSHCLRSLSEKGLCAFPAFSAPLR